jgi:hypothetical protein
MQQRRRYQKSEWAKALKTGCVGAERIKGLKRTPYSHFERYIIAPKARQRLLK